MILWVKNGIKFTMGYIFVLLFFSVKTFGKSVTLKVSISAMHWLELSLVGNFIYIKRCTILRFSR